MLIHIKGAKGRKDEGGNDLRYIQELLGHASSKTAEIYAHLSQKSLGKIKSPYYVYLSN
jgi:site-specific recombinase XerC